MLHPPKHNQCNGALLIFGLAGPFALKSLLEFPDDLRKKWQHDIKSSIICNMHLTLFDPIILGFMNLDASKWIPHERFRTVLCYLHRYFLQFLHERCVGILMWSSSEEPVKFWGISGGLKHTPRYQHDEIYEMPDRFDSSTTRTNRNDFFRSGGGWN